MVKKVVMQLLPVYCETCGAPWLVKLTKGARIEMCEQCKVIQ